MFSRPYISATLLAAFLALSARSVQAQVRVIVGPGPGPIMRGPPPGTTIIRGPNGPLAVRQTPAGTVILRPSPYGPVVVQSPFAPPGTIVRFAPSAGTVISSAATPGAQPTASTTGSALQITSLLDGTAKEAGLKANDVIVAIDGKRTRTFDDLRSALTASKGVSIFTMYTPGAAGVRTVDVKVVDTKIGASVVEVPVELDESAFAGGESALLVKTADAAASGAGLVAGDVIVSVDGKRVTNEAEWSAALAASKGQSEIGIFKPSQKTASTVTVPVTNGTIGVTVEKVPIEVQK